MCVNTTYGPFFTFNSIKVQLSQWRIWIHASWFGSFNSIKVQLSLINLFLPWDISHFQFHKGTIKPNTIHVKMNRCPSFNSIKVQLSPVVFGYIISLFTIGFDDTKLRNLIEKMSMGNYIFLGVLRQPLYLFVLQ